MGAFRTRGRSFWVDIGSAIVMVERIVVRYEVLDSVTARSRKPEKPLLVSALLSKGLPKYSSLIASCLLPMLSYHALFALVLAAQILALPDIPLSTSFWNKLDGKRFVFSHYTHTRRKLSILCKHTDLCCRLWTEYFVGEIASRSVASSEANCADDKKFKGPLRAGCDFACQETKPRLFVEESKIMTPTKPHGSVYQEVRDLKGFYLECPPGHKARRLLLDRAWPEDPSLKRFAGECYQDDLPRPTVVQPTSTQTTPEENAFEQALRQASENVRPGEARTVCVDITMADEYAHLSSLLEEPMGDDRERQLASRPEFALMLADLSTAFLPGSTSSNPK